MAGFEFPEDLTFNREATTLHTVWDSGLIDQEQLSYSELASWLLPRITRDQRREWRVTDPLIWIGESVVIRDRLYPAPAALELPRSCPAQR